MSGSEVSARWEDTPERLDRALLALGLVRSRNHAHALISEGRVRVGGVAVTKPAKRVGAGVLLQVNQQHTYVSRGALKLVAALDTFEIDVAGATALDIGASTGGFTQVLLERGATRVLAIDVGHGQLAPQLRNDSRVHAAEGFNARHLSPELLRERTGETSAPSIAVGDLSFISLTHILPAVCRVVSDDAHLIFLIKPQFEVGKEEIGQGVVSDPALQAHAIEQVLECAVNAGLHPHGLIRSPILGGQGNREFLVHLRVQKPAHFFSRHERIAEVTSRERGE